LFPPIWLCEKEGVILYSVLKTCLNQLRCIASYSLNAISIFDVLAGRQVPHDKIWRYVATVRDNTNNSVSCLCRRKFYSFKTDSQTFSNKNPENEWDRNADCCDKLFRFKLPEKKAADNCSVAVYVRRSPTRVESMRSRGKHPPGNSIPAQFFCMEAMLLQLVFFLRASSETSGGHDKIKLFCLPSRSSLEIVSYWFTVEGTWQT
jgi:hypothetical protein